jgi:uncharacterized protein (DUF4415 family)
MSASKQNLRPDWVDPDDAPELTEDFFAEADEFVGSRLIRRGRPRQGATKVSVTVRYDADLVTAFKATGKGWQTRMNLALRQFVAEHPLQKEKLQKCS